MKEYPSGSRLYENKGLKRLPNFVRKSVVKKYKKAANKRGWSLVKFVSYWLSKCAPKG